MHPQHPQHPQQPPAVYIEQKPDRAGTVALWLIVLYIAAPIVVIALCCAGCIGLGGLGLVGGAVSPSATPSP